MCRYSRYLSPGETSSDSYLDVCRTRHLSHRLNPPVHITFMCMSSLLTVESIDSTSPLRPLLTQDPPLREDDILVIALLWEKSLADRFVIA